ncbi:MAG: hypothetical protein WCK09_16410 [Bacteroidota bacterium]
MKTLILKLVSGGGKCPVRGMSVMLQNLWIGVVIIFLLLMKFEGFGQPTVLYTSLSNTTPASTNNRWSLNTVGAFRQYRFQANETGPKYYWAFSLGTPASWDYSTNWRPWTSGNVMSYNIFIPVGWANGARRNTSSGGSDGELNNIQNGYYYTFNVSPNAATDNIMAVLETSFNPVSFVSLVDAPAPYGARLATVTLSSTPSAGEHVYIRYTTDNYTTSTILEITNFGAGAIGTAIVPVPSTNGVTQKYYAYSSNKTKNQIDVDVGSNGQVVHDMFTLSLSSGASNVFTNPVVVTSSGGSTLMNSYATMKDAFDAINSGTNHTGTITIALIGNTTEAATAVLNPGNVAPASYSSIGIQPAGGSARTITGNLAAPLLDFNGADVVTIDGRQGGTGSTDSLTIRNNSTSAAANTSTIHFMADATNNIIKYCNVLGSATMDVTTVEGGTICFGTESATGNDNNTVTNCNIGPAGTNLPTKGICIKGNAGALNDEITITNNNIYDYFSATVPSSGIYSGAGSSACTFTNNKFYQTGVRTQTTGKQHAAIWINNTSGNNFTVSNNIIGYSSPTGTDTTRLVGVVWTQFTGICLSVGPTIPTSVQGNTIAAIRISGSCYGIFPIGFPIPTPPFIGIEVQAGEVNIGTVVGNTIGSMSATKSINYTSSSNSTYSSCIV